MQIVFIVFILKLYNSSLVKMNYKPTGLNSSSFQAISLCDCLLPEDFLLLSYIDGVATCILDFLCDSDITLINNSACRQQFYLQLKLMLMWFYCFIGGV